MIKKHAGGTRPTPCLCAAFDRVRRVRGVAFEDRLLQASGEDRH
jgi:hypothetical protein